MFGQKFLICATLLLMSSSALSQTVINLKDAEFPTITSTSAINITATPPTVKPTDSTTSTSTTTLSTTTSSWTSTTAMPTTSTPVPVSTTTPKPKPMPAPSTGSWNCSCIMVDMAAQFNFTYETQSGKSRDALYNVPKNATVDHCLCDSKAVQMMQLNWGSSKTPAALVLQFANASESVSLTMIKISMPVSTVEFPDAKENQTIQLIHSSNNTDFKAPEKMSYHCTRVEKFNMTETYNDNNTVGDISVSHVQVEAFRDSKATGYSAAHDCDSSTSDVVPIAVGIALAALILVVLISYLCARRRSTSRGYMSF